MKAVGRRFNTQLAPMMILKSMCTKVIIMTTIITVIYDLHLMAERLGMGDSNWTCTHKVAVGWAHLGYKFT